MSQPLCSQQTAKGTPCRNKAVTGSDRCSSHLRLIERTKLTPQLASAIVGQLQLGIHVNVVLVGNGIGKSTYYDWRERGKSGRKEDAVFKAFREQTDKARAQGEIALAMTVSAGARQDPHLALTVLERMYPERWARPSQRPAEPEEEKTAEPESPIAKVVKLAEERRRRR